MARILVVAIAALMIGCAGTGPQWYKAGAGQSEFDQASFECKAHMQQTAGVYNDPLVAMLAYGDNLMHECMRAKGWQSVNG